MVLNKIVNINVQRENRVLFSDQNYFLYRAYTIKKYSPDLIKKKKNQTPQVGQHLYEDAQKFTKWQ